MKKIGYVEYIGPLDFFEADFSYDILIRVRSGGYTWNRTNISVLGNINEWNLKLKQLTMNQFNGGIMLVGFRELKTLNVE